MANNKKTVNSRFVPYGEEVRIMSLVRAAFFTPMGRLFSQDSTESWGLPLFFEGPPSTAKTSNFYNFAKRMGLSAKFESLKPSTRGPEFFGCTPVPTDVQMPDGTTVPGFNFPLPARFAQKFAQGAGIILLDELTNAPPAVRPALLGFLQERELGEQKFSGRVRIFGAGNAVSESPTGQEFSPPEANRFGHLYFPDPSVAELAGYFGNGCVAADADDPIDLVAEESRVMREFYGREFARAIGAVSGFISRRSDLMRQQPSVSDPESSRAWASPRTWEYALRALASARCNDLTPTETEIFVGAFIGTAVSQEFFVWEREQDLPDPFDLLDGKAAFTPSVTRLDRTVAVLSSCTSVLTSPDAKKDRPSQEERAKRFWAILRGMVDEQADLLKPAVVALDRARLLWVSQDAREVMSKMLPVLTARRS